MSQSGGEPLNLKVDLAGDLSAFLANLPSRSDTQGSATEPAQPDTLPFGASDPSAASSTSHLSDLAPALHSLTFSAARPRRRNPPAPSPVAQFSAETNNTNGQVEADPPYWDENGGEPVGSGPLLRIMLGLSEKPPAPMSVVAADQKEDDLQQQVIAAQQQPTSGFTPAFNAMIAEGLAPSLDDMIDTLVYDALPAATAREDERERQRAAMAAEQATQRAAQRSERARQLLAARKRYWYRIQNPEPFIPDSEYEQPNLPSYPSDAQETIDASVVAAKALWDLGRTAVRNLVTNVRGRFAESPVAIISPSKPQQKLPKQLLLFEAPPRFESPFMPDYPDALVAEGISSHEVGQTLDRHDVLMVVAHHATRAGNVAMSQILNSREPVMRLRSGLDGDLAIEQRDYDEYLDTSARADRDGTAIPLSFDEFMRWRKSTAAFNEAQSAVWHNYADGDDDIAINPGPLRELRDHDLATRGIDFERELSERLNAVDEYYQGLLARNANNKRHVRNLNAEHQDARAKVIGEVSERRQAVMGRRIELLAQL